MEDNFGKTLPRRMPSTDRPRKPWEVRQPSQPEEANTDELIQAERRATESLEDVLETLESVKERLQEEGTEKPRPSAPLPEGLLQAKAISVHLEGDRLILGCRKAGEVAGVVRPLRYIEAEVAAEELRRLKLGCFESNGRAFILGEEAHVLSRVFGRELRSPLRRGVLDAARPEALAVLEEELKPLRDAKARVITAVVPEVTPEEEPRLRFHQEMMSKLLGGSTRQILATTVTEAVAKNIPPNPQRLEAIVHLGNHWTGAALAFGGMMGRKWGILGGLEDILKNAGAITGTPPERLRELLLKRAEEKDTQLLRMASRTYQSEILEEVAAKLSEEIGGKFPEGWDGMVWVCGEGALLPQTAELMKESLKRGGLGKRFTGLTISRSPLFAPARGAVLLAEAALGKAGKG